MANSRVRNGQTLMLRSSGWIVLGILSATPALLTQTADQPAANATPSVHKAHHTKAKAVKPLPLPALPSGPLRQLPMDQIPATPAKVTYQGGLLTIAAQNSPLSEILREVHKLTGATIEIPRTMGADERVITHLGPGSPRDVLVALLNGSSFNYVMLGSNADPSVISNVILSSKSGAGGEAQTAANIPQNAPPPGVVMAPHPMPQQQAFNPQAGQAPQPDNAEGEAPPEEEQQQDPAADENANADEQAQPGQPGQVEQGQQDPNQPNAGPKTPEQILEMLRRQQQPGAVTPPPQGQEQPPEQQ